MRDIVNQHRPVPASCGDALAVGRKRDGGDGVEVSWKRTELFLRGEVPNLKEVRWSAEAPIYSQHATVWREREPTVCEIGLRQSNAGTLLAGEDIPKNHVAKVIALAVVEDNQGATVV